MNRLGRLEAVDGEEEMVRTGRVNGSWRPLRSATEGDENGRDWRDIGSMPWAIEAEYGLAMRGCV